MAKLKIDTWYYCKLVKNCSWIAALVIVLLNKDGLGWTAEKNCKIEVLKKTKCTIPLVLQLLQLECDTLADGMEVVLV